MGDISDDGLHVGIAAIEYYLPQRVLTSTELAGASGLDVTIIESKLGVKRLHIAKEDECPSDLAIAGAEKLFATTGFSRERVEALVVCTQNPDYKTPSTACLVQNLLRVPTSCMAFDINQACSGFPYGLAIGAGLVKGGICRKVLLIMSETYSKVVSRKDKTVGALIGDGAAAILLLPARKKGILGFDFGTDGTGYDFLIVPAGGSRLPSNDGTRACHEDRDGNIRSKEHLRMQGRDILEFAVRTVPRSVGAALRNAGLGLNDADIFIFHQANKFMLELLSRKMGVSSEKVYVNLTETGNTVSASIPIALKMAVSEGRIQPGDIVVLCGFGAGLSWGSVVLRWQGEMGSTKWQII